VQEKCDQTADMGSCKACPRGDDGATMNVTVNPVIGEVARVRERHMYTVARRDNVRFVASIS
jgi:hypothetical protein